MKLFLVYQLLFLISAGCGKDKEYFYVSNERGGTISVIDAGKDEPVKIISVNARARGIRFSPDKQFIYVALSSPRNQPYNPDENKIAQIDAGTHEILQRFDVGSDPEQLAISKDGKKLYASNEDAGTASVFDISSGKITKTVIVGIEPEGVTISPDGRWVYVTAETSNSISVIETQTDEIVASFLVGSRPRDVAFANGLSNDVSVISTSTERVLKTMKVGEGPWGIAIEPQTR